MPVSLVQMSVCLQLMLLLAMIYSLQMDHVYNRYFPWSQNKILGHFSFCWFALGINTHPVPFPQGQLPATSGSLSSFARPGWKGGDSYRAPMLEASRDAITHLFQWKCRLFLFHTSLSFLEHHPPMMWYLPHFIDWEIGRFFFFIKE